MKITIYQRNSDRVILEGDYNSLRQCLQENRDTNLRDADLSRADLSRANLSDAILRDADLRCAILSGADLSGAILSGAILREADLSGAILSGADLSGAILSGAVGLGFLGLPDLYILKTQPPETVLTAWKWLMHGLSPYRSCCYEVGEKYTFDDGDADERNVCAAGCNVATLTWCLKDGSTADEFIEVSFTAGQIVAVPFATDGKFRVKGEVEVVRKLNRDEAVAFLEERMGKK